MRILYFGTSEFAQPALRALVDHGEEVVAVVTQPDRPAGRGAKLTSPPLKETAAALRLPILQPESCRTPEFLDIARACAPELSVVAAYGQFLPDALRLLPPCGSVNLHGSLLPKYRGAAPIQRAVWQGEEETGVCLMWMARAMDAGDLIACAREPILPEDTAGTLSDRLAIRAAELLITWLPALAAGTAPHFPQHPDAVTLAPMIRKEERMVEWSQSAAMIARQIHALAPAPSATATFRGQPVKILRAKAVISNNFFKISAGDAGRIVEVIAGVGILIATGQDLLQITHLQPAGKRAMSGTEFINGYHPEPGEQFSP